MMVKHPTNLVFCRPANSGGDIASLCVVRERTGHHDEHHKPVNEKVVAAWKKARAGTSVLNQARLARVVHTHIHV